MKFLPLLWSGLFRKRLRTLLTLLSITVAFLLFGLLRAVGFAFESGVEAADARRLLTTARYSIIDPLPLAHLRSIEQVDGVERVAFANWFGAKYQNESNAFAVFTVDPARYFDLYPEFTIDPAQRDTFIRTRTAAVAGKRLFQRYGWRLGQKLPLHSEIHAKSDGKLDWEFDLVGMIDAEDPAQQGNTDVVLIHNAYFDEARRSGKGTTGWFIVRISESADPRRVADAIDRRFRNSQDETKTQPEKEFAVGFAKQIGDIGALVTRILVAVFFTLLLLTGNTMAQSIRERIPEFATLKTLGFTDRMVGVLVVGEAGLLLLLGAAAGMGLAAAILPPLNAATGGRFPPLYVDLQTGLSGIGIALGLALLVGLPPAFRVYRAVIVDALRMG